MSDTLFLKIAKLFVYLAPISMLVVASSMFFPFIVGKAIFFRVTVELGLFFYLLYLLSPGSREKVDEFKRIAKHPIFLSVAAFTLLFLISTVTAENPQIAFWSNFERGEGGLQILHYGIFFALATLVIRTKKEWRSYITWLLGIGILVSGYALGQRLNYLNQLAKVPRDQNPWASFFGDGARPSGTLGNPLYLSTFLIFMFFYGIIFFKENAGKGIRIALAFLLAFQAFVFIYLSQSRNGIAGVAVGIIALLVYWSMRGGEIKVYKFNIRQISVALIALVVISAGIFVSTRTNPFWQEVPGLRRFANANLLTGLTDRIWVWGAATSAFIERPVLGWGPENFPIPFDKYYNPNHYGLDSWFDRAHDVYLEYIVSGGITLFLAYMAIWFCFFRELARRRNKAPAWLTGIIIAFGVAYLVQSVTAFEVLPVYLMLYTVLAFIIRYYSTEDVPERRATASGPARHASAGVAGGQITEVPLVNYLAIGAVGIMILLSFYYANYLPFEKNRMLLTAAATSDVDQQSAYARFLGTLDYYSPIGQQESIQYFTLFAIRLLESNAQNPAFRAQKDGINELVKKISGVYEKNENSPYRAVGVKTLYYDALVKSRAAMIMEDEALLATAQKELERGAEIAPTRFEFIYALLDIAVAKRDEKLAKPLIAKAKFLRPDLEKNSYYANIFATSTPTSTSATSSN